MSSPIRLPLSPLAGRLFLSFALAGGSLSLLACDDDSEPEPTLPMCEDTEPAGTESLEPVASTLVGTIEPVHDRMDRHGDLDPITEDGELEYEDEGLAEYQRGPGLDRVQWLDLGGSTDFGTRHSLAYFAQMSDVHLVDDESPTRWGKLDNAVKAGSVRPQEAYLPAALSAMNRTFARIERPERPYDFAVINGDQADSAQYNELRWFLDIMDGVPGTEVDSGDDNDPVPGPDNDPKDPFDPVPFPAPWLYTAGNHDVLVLGFNDPADWVGTDIGDFSGMGTRDYTQWWAPIADGVIPADPDRHIVDRDEIVTTLFDTAASPGPVGHGFASADTDTSLGANYVYDAIPGLVRVIHLDTNDRTAGSPGIVMRATVDGFLRPALEQAEADGVLTILVSHHGLEAIDTLEGESGDPIADAVPPAELRDLVVSYPVVILWLVGHVHTNYVAPIEGPDTEHPGCWEVMTSALADWPLQGRISEIVDNGNGTLSIFSTTIDFDEQSCAERRFRRLALVDYLSAWTDDVLTAPEYQNVELVIPVPTAAAANVAAALDDAPTRIESETTLRGE